MYCVKCRKHTETLNTTTFTARNGRPMRKGICADCGKAKTQFIKTGSGLFNKAVSKTAFRDAFAWTQFYWTRYSTGP